MHGQEKFPFRKAESDLDIGLTDGPGDGHYLESLAKGLNYDFSAAQPELTIYLAGADRFEGNRLRRVSLTKSGLESRDRKVLSMCRDTRVPVAVVMAGGYATSHG